MSTTRRVDGGAFEEVCSEAIVGLESFRVELRGGSVTYRKADRIIRKLPHAKPDYESLAMQGSAYYIVDDGRHLIEVELRDEPVRLSCRFTLCHPSSVDSVFLELVRELMLRLSMEAKICDDVLPAHRDCFTLDHYAELSGVISRSIAARRKE